MDKTGLAKPQAAAVAAGTGGVPGRRLGRGRPFPKGQSGNPAGRPAGARNRRTLAAVRLLDGEAEALTRKAVELALAGDAMALKLCLERILPPARERAVRFALPAIEADDFRRRVEAPLSPEDEEMFGRLAGLLGDLRPERGF